MRQMVFAMLVAAIAVAGCATKEEQALGNVFSGANVGGPAVYQGDIKKKYRILKELRQRRKQICGAMYYDIISGSGWMKAEGKVAGADAVINYQWTVVEPLSLLSCGVVEASGTAVKFEN